MPSPCPSALVDDSAFDRRLPAPLRAQSEAHFTPVEVARVAIHMLAPRPGTTILDVGSGVGKFCLVAAHERPAARFVGVERRPSLVEIARHLAAETGIANVRFECGDALDLDWTGFDGFYLFNPFGEHLTTADEVLDSSVEHDATAYITSVVAVQDRLATVRPSARVVTYHGFGGPVPDSFEQVLAVTIGWGRLVLWVKTDPAESGRM